LNEWINNNVIIDVGIRIEIRNQFGLKLIIEYMIIGINNPPNLETNETNPYALALIKVGNNDPVKTTHRVKIDIPNPFIITNMMALGMNVNATMTTTRFITNITKYSLSNPIHFLLMINRRMKLVGISINEVRFNISLDMSLSF